MVSYHVCQAESSFSCCLVHDLVKEMATVTITLGAGGLPGAPNGWTVAVHTLNSQPVFSSDTGDIESVQFTALPNGNTRLQVRAMDANDDIRLDLQLSAQDVTGTAVAKGLGKGGAPPGAAV